MLESIQDIAAKVLIVMLVIIVLYSFYQSYIKRQIINKRKMKLAENNEFIKKNEDKLNTVIKNHSAFTLINRIKIVLVLAIFIIWYVILYKYMTNNLYEFNPYICFSAIIISFIILVIILSSIKDNYIKNYKEEVIKKIINSFNSDLEYYPKEGFTKEEYDDCNFRESYNEFYSEDLITYQKNIFRYADINTINEYTDSDGHTHESITFCGSLASATIKNINCKILFDINHKGEWYLNNEYEKITLENDEFNKTYTVTTDNDLIAYKILTPDIMEKFLKLQHDTIADMVIRIINDKIYIRFPTGNSFKPYLWNKSLEKRSIIASIAVLQEMIEILGEIRDIIDKKNL